MKMTVCVITGSRAEYGLLYPLLKAMQKDGAFKVELVVTGSHLRREFGCTYREIEEDGFRIRRKVCLISSDDTVQGMAASIGKGVPGFTEVLAELVPDMVVLLGDRFEMLSASIAAHMLRVPIAHIHGGEVTAGAIDDAFRHAITKMSTLHFAAADTYRRRIIQLGEFPGSVFNVGALGLDNIRSLALLSRSSMERETGLPFGKRNLLITFHPATLDSDAPARQFTSLLGALDELKDTHLYFTSANADAGGREINDLIDRYVAGRPAKACAFASLGRVRYLSMMQYVDAVVGNSSSGIIEAPSFRIGTVNIGDRQAGRIRARSVIDCEPASDSIRKALKAVYSEAFRSRLKRMRNPYGDGRTAVRIVRTLKKYDLAAGAKKGFFDIASGPKDK